MNIYDLSHFVLGGLAVYQSLITPVFLVYQFFQLTTNQRFFFFDEVKVRSGNSLAHTMYKIGEFIVGYVVITIYS